MLNILRQTGDIDDLTLSQICESLGNENLAFEALCDLSLNLNEDGYVYFGVHVGMGNGRELVFKRNAAWRNIYSL